MSAFLLFFVSTWYNKKAFAAKYNTITMRDVWMTK